MWGECVSLLNMLSPHVRRNALMPLPSPNTATNTDNADTLAPDSSSSWDELKVVMLQSIGAMSEVIHLSLFGAVWETLVMHIRDALAQAR